MRRLDDQYLSFQDKSSQHHRHQYPGQWFQLSLFSYAEGSDLHSKERETAAMEVKESGNERMRQPWLIQSILRNKKKN